MLLRRGVGAADRAGFENRCALMGTAGSNPALSVMSTANNGREQHNYLCCVGIRRVCDVRRTGKPLARRGIPPSPVYYKPSKTPASYLLTMDVSHT
jgi:hypothetical protein